MAEPTTSSEPEVAPIQFLATATLVLLGLAGAAWTLQMNICAPCKVPLLNLCSEPKNGDCRFFLANSRLSFTLILVHMIPYLLIPLTMRIVWIRTEFLQAHTDKQMNPFAMQLGLACICMSLAFEFGWHVTTNWYYRDDFHVLNFTFYFFLISAFALWADGFFSSLAVDALFLGALAEATRSYVRGALPLIPDDKSPLYIALTITFITLTIRGMIVLDDKRMLFVPFFSIGVNLAFASMLQGLSKDEYSELNYLFHIAHDILGTELGVAVFAYLVWDNKRLQEQKGLKQN